MSERAQDYPRLPMKGDDNSWFFPQNTCKTCEHWRARDGGCLEAGEVAFASGRVSPMFFTSPDATCKRWRSAHA